MPMSSPPNNPAHGNVVVGTGRIVYKGGMGPFKFDTDELEEFLDTTHRG